MTIGNWNGYTFEVSPKLIRGFNGLSIKGSCETKDKTKSKQKYVKRKAAQPAEISLTVQLNALTGVTNVRTEGLNLVADSKKGASAYFYIGDSKLVPCKVMLVSATVENVEMAGTTWISCDVKLTMKQSGKDGSSGGGKGKKSKKKSAKKSSGKKGSGGGTNKSTAWDAAKKAAKAVASGVVKSAKAISKAAKSVWTGFKTAITKAVVKTTAKKTTNFKKSPTTGRVAQSGSGKRLAATR